MQLLGIGPLELLLIAVIAIIVLGPKGMVKGAREVGKTIRKVVKSPVWKDIVDTSHEIREFPRKIAREAGIEKEIEDLRRSTRASIPEFNRTHTPEITPLSPAEEEQPAKGEALDEGKTE
jgi:Sec-independent protein translocase protein TatA